MEDSHYKFYIRKSSVGIVKGLKIVTVGLIISGLVVSGILLTSTIVLQASNGNNSEQKQPENVFINAYEGRNFGSVQSEQSTSQSQASSQEQETSQSQS